MTDPQLHIEPQWREAFARAGLDRFEALMAFEGGECLSRHARGQTYRLGLPDGRTVFLKRDVLTMCKQILADLLHLRRPQPLTWKERRAARQVAQLGIDVPRAVAWGQRRRMGLAHQGVLVSTALPGLPLDEYFASPPPPRARRAVLTAVGRALAKLYEAGLSWPDLLPKHVFVSDAGQRPEGPDIRLPEIGLLDLERMEPCGNALVRRMPAQVRRFCDLLRRCGAAQADLDALLDAVGYEDLVDYAWPEGD